MQCSVTGGLVLRSHGRASARGAYVEKLTKSKFERPFIQIAT